MTQCYLENKFNQTQCKMNHTPGLVGSNCSQVQADFYLTTLFMEEFMLQLNPPKKNKTLSYLKCLLIAHKLCTEMPGGEIKVIKSENVKNTVQSVIWSLF